MEKSNIRSLAQKRQERNNRARKNYQSPEARILELEGDLVRVIDMLISMNETVEHHAKMIRIMTRLVTEASKLQAQEQQASFSFEGASQAFQEQAPPSPSKARKSSRREGQ